jgi:hypothetical protein
MRAITPLSGVFIIVLQDSADLVEQFTPMAR